jgi:hypothetical protein
MPRWSISRQRGDDGPGRVHDARAGAVVASHIDALVLLASQRKPGSGAVKLLIQELEQAVARIPLHPVQENK